jgi:hypothetical protein
MRFPVATPGRIYMEWRFGAHALMGSIIAALAHSVAMEVSLIRGTLVTQWR